MSKSICQIDYKGNKWWWTNTLPRELHREDGPAVEFTDGAKMWYSYGKIHRLDGPAIEHTDGSKSWYFNHKKIICSSQEEFEKLLRLKAFW